MKRPVTVFVCGVQKGGTTSLHRYFIKHPGLSAPRVKEVQYFSNEKVNWRAPNYQQYHGWFPDKTSERLRFDITPAYSFWPPALGRIADYNPEAKLIFLFRDPFDRAYSHWCMQYARNNERLLFSEAIRGGRNRLIGMPVGSPEWRMFTYIERGYYDQQVRRAINHFPRQNILFLRSEDLLSNHNETLAKIAGFLEIEPFGEQELIAVHKTKKIKFPSQKTEEDRRMVADLLGREMENFKALTGLDISKWPVMRQASAMAGVSATQEIGLPTGNGPLLMSRRGPKGSPMPAKDDTVEFPYKLKKNIFGPHDRDKPATNVIVNRDYKLAYVPIPKNACTAIKILFFSLNKGTEFNEHFSAIHGRFDYRASDFDRFAAADDYFKFVVVRDPVERFVSAYNNRVKMYGELSEKKLKAQDGDHKKLTADFQKNGLSFDPDLNEFARKIADYVNASTNIKHHFVPQHLFFHGRLDAFHKVYNIRQLASLTDELSNRVGRKLELRNVQETKGLENAARVSDLTADELATVTAYYAEDYEILGPYLATDH